MDDKYLLVILVLAILIGASRLPSLGRNLGQGIREFKQGISESFRSDDEPKDEPPKDEPRDGPKVGDPKVGDEAAETATEKPPAG